MEIYSALLATSLLWFFSTGLFGARILKLLPSSIHPRLLLTLWFGGLYSLVVSLLSSLITGVIVMLNSYGQLHTTSVGLGNLLLVVLVSLLPWLAVALAGGTLAHTVTKWGTAITNYRSVSNYIGGLGVTLKVFRGIPVARVELEVPLALVSDEHGLSRIIMSSTALNMLSSDELNAVLWHEVGHVVGGHNSLKRVAAVAASLLGWLPLARLMVSHTHELMEQEADLVALRHIHAEVLASARSKFAF